jgi:hypothetical protein
MADPKVVWAAGQESILFTRDGGQKWEEDYSAPDLTIYDLRITADRFAGWAAGRKGPKATILRKTVKGWMPAQINGAPESLLKPLHGIAFADRRSGWAVGEGGAIFHSTDGGETWDPQPSGTTVTLYSVASSDSMSAWAAGEDGTILHTTDGGRRWDLQASAVNWTSAVLAYRRRPAPMFWLLLACSIAFFIRSMTAPRDECRTNIEELVSTDSPVTDVQDDRLGHRALVDRLTSFVSNPNTRPPLVISLQAAWGMGKTSVLRMLQSNLKQNRAAVTVWFNAWHYQREDQILAYLLETIQKEAIPVWVTPVGVRFRLNLLLRRLAGNKDRLTIALLATAALIFAAAGGIPSQPAWQKWIPVGPGLVLSALMWRALTAFHSDPEQLAQRSGGFLTRTLRELASLPSLAGKTDVRRTFAENFHDVVEALKPQRLVIFLDDLDRCRPEQVLQTLEAVNFRFPIRMCGSILAPGVAPSCDTGQFP